MYLSMYEKYIKRETLFHVRIKVLMKVQYSVEVE